VVVFFQLYIFTEIWDALRAATQAAEGLDFQLSQAILDGACISVPNGYLTECYDELGTQYKVPIYCLSKPINIVKEDNGRDSPAEYSEPVDTGTETVLKLRLSSTCSDIKLSVFSKDTIGQCKKKLQVCTNYILLFRIGTNLSKLKNGPNYTEAENKIRNFFQKTYFVQRFLLKLLLVKL
jgi:hypothetical protein